MKGLLLGCELLSLAIIVLAAVFFRTFTLSDVPRGVADDEVIEGLEASFVARGEGYPVFFVLGGSLVGLLLGVSPPGNRVSLVAMRPTQPRRLAMGHHHLPTVARPLARTSLTDAPFSHDGRRGQ